MKKLLLSIAFVLVLTFGSVLVSFADNGPHGGFNTATTDSCSGCHRSHTSAAQQLLMTTTADLCESCHGTIGSGADTNVWDGVYTGLDPVTESPAEGAVNHGLKGGGFDNAIMDTNLTGSAVSAPTTSAHSVDGNPVTSWGSGSIGTGAGQTITMDCGNCHNPHGNSGPSGSATYRILRPIPNGAASAIAVTIADVATKNYTVDDAGGNYFGQNYTGVESALSQWCAQCHNRYLAPGGAEVMDSGDPMFAFRHRSNGDDGINCVDCHVAHGTSATMDTNSGSVPWPDGSTTVSGNARSSLLRLDNRGICVQCHENP
jgi:predicted CXXCH cytochrome family protein